MKWFKKLSLASAESRNNADSSGDKNDSVDGKNCKITENSIKSVNDNENNNNTSSKNVETNDSDCGSNANRNSISGEQDQLEGASTEAISETSETSENPEAQENQESPDSQEPQDETTNREAVKPLNKEKLKLKRTKKVFKLADFPQNEIEVLHPDEFFQDPAHCRMYQEEAEYLKLKSEWVIVPNQDELESWIEQNEPKDFCSADFQEMYDKQESKETPKESKNPDKPTGSRPNSKPSPSRKQFQPPDFELCPFGDKIPPEAILLGCFIDVDVLTGIPLKKTSKKSNTRLIEDSPGPSKLSSTDKKAKQENAFARSLMGAIMKHKIFEKACPDDDCEEHDDPARLLDVEEIFGLDDDGNIVLDMSHIIVERGYGFLMKRQKRIYRMIMAGKEIDEDYTMKRSFVEIVKCIFKCFNKIFFGHPRNKSQSGGPGDSVGAYTLQLANDRTSTFSRNIENFIACTKESREAAPQVVMRNMRQFMSGMKNYLVKHGEGEFQQEVQKARSRLKSDEFLNLDAILEGVMHQLVILPLREHLYSMFVDFYTRSGDIQLLVENVKYACSRNPLDFGIRPSVAPPSSAALNRISLLLLKLQEAEQPLEKLDLFLCVIAAIFEATGCPRGQQLGADDFLPILVFVVAKCGFVGAEIEAEFMWGLLQPPLLSGEAGYYLTALCSAVHVLKSFMASDNEGSGSLDWRSSSLPACSSVLRVIIPDEYNGSLQTRTLPVRPHTTTRDVCRIIAHKARITNPQDYGLFKLVDGEETILTDAECPQDARIAARGKHCMLAYKRIDAKIAWPTASASFS